MKEERKSFEQLVSEKVGCFEFAWNGFIRMYEETDKKCECKDCQAVEKLNNDIKKVMTRRSYDY